MRLEAHNEFPAGSIRKLPYSFCSRSILVIKASILVFHTVLLHQAMILIIC